MIGGEIGRPVANSTGPGTPMPIPQTVPGMLRVVRWSSVEQLLDPAEARPPGPASIVGRLVVVAEDPAGEVGQRDVDARRAEVGDEDVAGVGPERELARRPAARARARRRPR